MGHETFTLLWLPSDNICFPNMGAGIRLITLFPERVRKTSSYLGRFLGGAGDILLELQLPQLLLLPLPPPLLLLPPLPVLLLPPLALALGSLLARHGSEGAGVAVVDDQAAGQGLLGRNSEEVRQVRLLKLNLLNV